MNKKKKLALGCILFPLVVIMLACLCLFVSSFFRKDKLYCFPQADMYMKIVRPPMDRCGYVLFSKDSVFSLSDSVDYVKICPSETSWVSFIINPLENNKIFVIYRWDDVQINQVNFIMEKISRKDTAFFKEYIIPETAGTRSYKVKKTYFEITVEGYLQSVFLANYGERLNKIEPIKE
jgi:hypothetical protein